MAEQPKQDRVWDFGMEAYLPSDNGKPATEHTLILGATSSGKTAFLNALLSAEAAQSETDPDAECEPAQ
jgi:type IV secretory pathway VirB4 component